MTLVRFPHVTPRRRITALLALLMLTLVGCDALNPPPPPTALPFRRYSAQDVATAFARAGLSVNDLTIARPDDGTLPPGAPVTFVERLTFSIPSIAPAGGQIMIFGAPDTLQAWLSYLERQRARSDTRRAVVYTYTNANALLFLNSRLTNDEAGRYRDVFLALGG